MLWLLITALSFNIANEHINNSTLMHFGAAFAGSGYLYLDARFNWESNTVFKSNGYPYPIKRESAWSYSIATITAMGLAKELIDGFNKARNDGFSFTDFMADVTGALAGATFALVVVDYIYTHKLQQRR